MFKKIAQSLRPPIYEHIGRIRIEYGEILSQWDCEAILFFMQPTMEWGGGLNKAVLSMAGPGLDTYVLEHVRNPKSGDVFALPPFATPHKKLFMAILPPWDGGNGFEERDLLNCYRGAIEQAQELGLKRLAIPAMGRDKRDFPHIRFARLALKGILEKLDARMEYVKIVCIDHTMMSTYQGQIEKLKGRTSP
jgi:O-acetyl-ADP-ribose deacetylase